MMEMAKVTSKGQITIPISIRRNLGINEGDKILFINKEDGVLMVNPDTFQGDITEEVAPVASKPGETKKTAKKKAPDSMAPPVAAAELSSAPVATPGPAAELSSAQAHAEELKPDETSYTEDSVEDSYTAIEYDTETVQSDYASPPSAPVPLPIYDEPEKPDIHTGGINLSTLLDDIRSIGSNI